MSATLNAMLPMARAASTFLLMLFMLVHSFAMAGHFSSAHSGDFEHSVMHWADIPHHHDAGVYQLDDTAESLSHVQADGCMTTFTLPSAQAMVFSTGVGALERPMLVVSPRPPPYLEGPRRPPRLFA